MNIRKYSAQFLNSKSSEDQLDLVLHIAQLWRIGLKLSEELIRSKEGHFFTSNIKHKSTTTGRIQFVDFMTINRVAVEFCFHAI